ncbi:hypothetical protein HNR23_004660 [Nocardiopsis mwathae]|uniref:Pycsar effector protein domain-containing protein n=1 Tax=Nocardiopsis mwathae TaxID=1472723 RepID=A0A7W9YMA3_9ACTN|nr:hypothetical protein [Nocardiopsis mwathae]MBB6174600.1 hypothetical protein [Nocardiopsis mwathae]
MKSVINADHFPKKHERVKVMHHDPDDISAALASMTLFQNNVQQADGKVGTLLVAYAGAAVAAMSSQSELTEQGGVVAAVLLATFTFTFLGSGYHLAQALRPRMGAPRATNRFGIAGARACRPGDRAITTAEAWEMSQVLAVIARRKNFHVARAIPWVAAMLCVGLSGAVAALIR